MCKRGLGLGHVRFQRNEGDNQTCGNSDEISRGWYPKFLMYILETLEVPILDGNRVLTTSMNGCMLYPRSSLSRDLLHITDY